MMGLNNIPMRITCPKLNGPEVLDEIERVERLDKTLLRRARRVLVK